MAEATMATTAAGAEERRAALLVINVQVGVIAEPEPCWEHEAVLARIAGMVDRARAAGTPVIFIQHESSPTGYAPMRHGAEGWQVHPAVAPLPGEPCLRKRACDSFSGTELGPTLARLGVTDLVVCGCASEQCVDTTVRQALSLGYDVTLVSDAHTTLGNGVLSAEQIVAHTNVTLENLIHHEHECVLASAAEVEFAGVRV